MIYGTLALDRTVTAVVIRKDEPLIGNRNTGTSAAKDYYGAGE